jgi:lysophospholipid acyltransferase (LPLAT)-like uncharacterized protein
MISLVSTGRPSRLPARKLAEAGVIAAVASPLLRLLGTTWKWQEGGTEHLDRIHREGRQPIYALWHGRILPGTLYLRNRDIVVMTSENFDGEWVARIIQRFGYEPARGSTSRGGARALAQLRREMRKGRPTAFTVDGPRGPAGVAQAGAVWLAGATGNPVLPFHVEASAKWTTRSWDRHQIPKPGSKVAAVMGPPIEVPEGATPDVIEEKRQDLERALARLRDEALRVVGLKE